MFKKALLTTMFSLSLVAGEYVIDNSHSRVGFTVKHMMISNVKGEFTKYDGDIEFDEKSGIFTLLRGEVDASSIDTGIQKRDDHLRSPDFFDVKKFPAIKFNLISQKGDKLTADLTIHGVTKRVDFELEMGGIAKDPWGNQRIGFSFTGKINRSDFGLNWNKAIETGGFIVGDQIKLEIDMEGISMD
jgi:polyisoprenoid-binding protein YceI